MTQDTVAAPDTQQTLFALLARRWSLDAPVTAAAFNAAGTAVAFAMADGRAAVVPVADTESPSSRIRIEFDSGRTTIRPRSRPVPPPTVVGPFGTGAPLLTAFGQQGFCMAGNDGSLHRVTARGQSLRFGPAGLAPIAALAGQRGADRLAVARDRQIALVDDTGSAIATATPGGPVEALAFAADGLRLAAAQGDRVTVYDTAAGLGAGPGFALSAPATSLVWDRTGRWLACGCADRSVGVIDLASARVHRLEDFPSDPRSLDFCSKPAAILAAGAFRLAAWDLQGAAPRPLRTGRAGLVPATAVAARPGHGLAAAGYANGHVILSPLGEAGELLLRAGTGGGDAQAVTALAWSADAAHLAIGTEGGEAALASFPEQFFKPHA